MLRYPFLFISNLNFIDWQIPELTGGLYRNGQPGPAIGCTNLISIDETVLFELHVIEHDVNVRNRDPMEVPQPGQIRGLIDGNDHILADLYRYTVKSRG